MMMARVVVVACVFILSIVGLCACGGSQYQLPPPPAADDQREVAANPADQAELERKRYLEARAALIELYGLLSKERFEEAEQYLSQQTRDFLAHEHPSGDPSVVLSEGQLTLPDGRAVSFDPVELLIGGNLRRIEDSTEGADEHETPNRRELFVVDSDGEKHQVVMILEGGRWVLHRTSTNSGQE